MNDTEIRQLVNRQREYFLSGATLPLTARLEALKKLKSAVKRREEQIHQAIQADLGKSSFESYMCETGLTLSEITYMERHLRSFAREKRVHTPLAQFHSRSFKKPSPYGVVLIMSPWNYPFLLTMEPLTDALAAGNTVILKPSAYSPHTSEVIRSLIEECFDPSLAATVTGGRAENTCLLNEHFDYIFFTGSQAVGRQVMRKASEHLTPVTLELGGKSPCIVEKTANLKLAAKRIVFGKFLNCGQTCVAPDYLLCDAAVREPLIAELKKQIQKQYGHEPLANIHYGKIINEKHFQRVCRLIAPSKVIHGGSFDPKTLRIEPTILNDITWEDACMQEEIFGPVLPILTCNSLEEAIQTVNSKASPLALYLFTSDKSAARKVTSRCGFGGGCINDTVIHLATSEMGFGGFGESGMGSYHGKEGFATFSHSKSVVDKKTWMDLPMRYQPYRKGLYGGLLRLFIR